MTKIWQKKPKSKNHMDGAFINKINPNSPYHHKMMDTEAKACHVHKECSVTIPPIIKTNKFSSAQIYYGR